MPNQPKIPKPEAQSRRVGFAVVGLGELSAEELIPALRTSQHAYLAAVVTGEPDKGRAFAKAAGLSDADAYTYEQFEELGKRDDVQAVYIVLPNNLHRDYAERAAKLGKHVLCEKPLADTTKDAEAIVKACKDAGVLLMAAYRIQYTPHHWAAKKAVAGGKLGSIKLLDSIHTQVEDDASAWRLSFKQAGGGPLVDVGIYCLNTMRFVTGLEPEWIYAAVHQPKGDARFKEMEESMSVMLGFPGGLIANMLTSYGAVKTDTLRVLGEAGSVTLDPAFLYVGLDLELSNKAAKTTPQFAAYNQFTLEVDHFAECIQSGKTPYTPGEEGLQDHRIMDAIYQSARSGKRVELEKFSGQDVFRNTDNVPKHIKAQP
ncbi:Gfo/Idh/MocA family oxidoreductase [Deinococcus detaillensis]|uniref:Gfo/Idh/MocA family oxidoreductase n=1 Tax=Deinococcus detaillensis TaxID=2592048 RepID=A0A553V3W5_9DEIO|nr:Gfo/Idh/MocA family oxidoreductase [Deinococcus detaillensis]TSA87188.1 Gfo/Idh/MocA family oxidoreductase [Deinococcus detaillensis]